MQTDSLRTRLNRDGYAIVPGIFGPEEIQRLRVATEQALSGKIAEKRVMYSDLGQFVTFLARFPEFNWIFYQEGVTQVAKEVFGDEGYFLNLDSSVLRNRLGGWHRDTGSNPFREKSEKNPACRIYNFGFYLEDHSLNDHRFQGLRVKRGSHMDPAGHEEISLEVKAGDLAIWDIRTLHTGPAFDRVETLIARVANRLLGTPHSLPAYLAKEAYWKLRGIKGRRLVSFSVGSDNDLTHDYARLMAVKTLGREGMSEKLRIDSNLRKELERRGIKYFCQEEAGEYRIQNSKLVSPSGRVYDCML
jgi:hypothetical protein